MKRKYHASFLFCAIPLLFAQLIAAQSVKSAIPADTTVDNWFLKDAQHVSLNGQQLSDAKFVAKNWYKATVPGTVLTTLVNNHVYPEPTYGENNRSNVIPESLARTNYWYRSTLSIPADYAGHHIWINFDGINYSAIVWVNGQQVGEVRGAFTRGIFDITANVKPGQLASIAVLVCPQPNPGIPHEHTLKDGVGHNGGLTAIDGPTFLSTIGWDWMPAVPDRDTGIWRKVFLSVTGPILVQDPVVVADLDTITLQSAALTIHSKIENVSNQPQQGVLSGEIGNIHFQRNVNLAPHSSQTVTFDPSNTKELAIDHPRLWWPNGYGPQNLYQLKLSFLLGKEISQEKDITFGIRKLSYTVSSTDALAFVVNGVPIFIRGGNWGLDEELKRIPRERLEAQIKMHQLANLNMIRNWVGQSTSEDFFDLCDKYGLLVWDEFFQPNPADGPDPTDLDTYMANVRDTVLNYRNHPSIAIWCARNEGNPPMKIDRELDKMLQDLDPTRLYQANSSDGRSIRSHGPYRWRVPREFYWLNEGFKSETGTMSIPTIESIQGMMPQKDWESINDDWAEHDFASGAASGDLYPNIISERYGAIKNLADFVRKSQLANYEDYRAMYEGRNARLFHPTTGIMTWMSHPAHPSFVWQLYHYDLETNSSFFAVKHASEMLHIQLDEITGEVQIINNYPRPLAESTVIAQVYNLDGSLASEQKFVSSAPASSAIDVGPITYHEPLTEVFFVKLRLLDEKNHLLSDNFYWLNHPDRADKFRDLNQLEIVRLDASLARHDENGHTQITITLKNSTSHIALMAHLQLHRSTGERVLPAYASDNYFTLLGGEEKVVTIECDSNLLGDGVPTVLVDGWNVDINRKTDNAVIIQLNHNAQVNSWPHTGLPVQISKLQ